jgi:hypothetical protein
MDSPNSEITKKERESSTLLAMNNEKKVDQQMIEQIETMIQNQFKVVCPALVFEYRPIGGNKEFSGWDYDDLFEFFGHFGDIEMLEIQGKLAIILFKTFYDAYTSREFLQNTSNFKETEKNNFIVRWYNYLEDESYISEQMKLKMKKFQQAMGEVSGKNEVNISYNNNTNNTNNNNQNQNSFSNYQNYGNYGNDYYNYNQFSYYNNSNNNNNSKNEYSGQQNYKNNYNRNSYSQNQNQHPNMYNNESQMEDNKSFQGQGDKYLQNGKYTCKYEIQIDNDNEFQVARRLIGAKGCNMKRIVEMCSRTSDGKFISDAVKLRLRGRGSGYKEGPNNRESEEPLHLCISSKFFDKYQRACVLVQELISNVYEEFRRYCDRIGKIPCSNLSIQKEEAVSSRKANSNMFQVIGREANVIVDN